MTEDSDNRIVIALKSHGYLHYAEVVKEILAENEKLKEINLKLSERLSWKCECKGCFNVK